MKPMMESETPSSASNSSPGDAPQSAGGFDSHECEDQLEFQTVLVDVLARLCTGSHERLDQEILAAQRRVCEVIGLDLCALWQWSPDDPGIMVLTHLYRGIDGPPIPDRMEAAEYHPWSLAQAQAGNVVVLSSTEDAPPEAERDLEVWRQFSVKTTLNVPLSTDDGPPFGVISFNDLQTERQWTEPIVSRLTLVSQIFANSIVRKRSEQALRRSEMRLSLAADSAGAGIWSLNLDTNRFWVTDRARTLFGFAEDEEVTLETFFDLVHLDDRAHIQESLDAITRTGKELLIEYRIQRKDGGQRWMASRGRMQRQVSAEEDQVVMGVTVDVTERKIQEDKLRGTLAQVRELQNQIEHENTYLKSQIQFETGRGSIVGESDVVERMLADARNVAPTDTAVLITGETGTGKELLAQVIHDQSARNKRAMIKVNCAALPAPLIESELFGREKGAYTGAMTQQVGRFEVAHKSTLMLDEIGDLPLDLQAKLLRVLQDGTFERLGSTRSIRSDVRIIAATNRDLAAMVAEGSFREDLFHRLNVFPIEVPPLRDRVDDIPRLVWTFVQEFNGKMGRSVDAIPKSVMNRLKQHPWTGNVRELRNAIERAMIVSRDRSLVISLPECRLASGGQPCSLEEIERRHIVSVLERVHWRISGSGGAAEILGLRPTTLHSRLKKLGISRPRS